MTSFVSLLALWLTASAHAQAADVTLRARTGVYADDNHTTIGRALISGQLSLGNFSLAVDEAMDVVSSASVDVRTSPELDVISSASQQQPQMSDTRWQTTLSLSYDDDAGHRASFAPTFAMENDYRSLGFGLRGACEILDRHTTISAGLTASTDVATSVFDADFRGASQSAGASIGASQVLSSSQVARLRYDIVYRHGTMASPYRAVRFGNYDTVTRDNGAVQFRNTLGPTSGYAERLPKNRLRHALDAEWLAEVWTDVSALIGYRLALDDWGIVAHALSAEMRLALSERWMLPIGYRYYHQLGADFWRGKYRLAESNYEHYSADKELGALRGHDASVSLAYRWEAIAAGSSGGSIDLTVHLFHYDYPGFALLSQRSALHVDLGLTVEL